MNKGLRTLHFYQLDVSPFDNDTIVGGTQDNGSWERGDGRDPARTVVRVVALRSPPRIDTDQFPSERECLGRGRGDDDDDDDNGNSGSGGEQVWVNTNIADGGHNGFDLGDPCFRLSGFQQGQTMVVVRPEEPARHELDVGHALRVLRRRDERVHRRRERRPHGRSAPLVGSPARVPLGQPGAEPRHDEAAAPSALQRLVRRWGR